MRKLSFAAMIMAILYLLAGIGILVFQNSLKLHYAQNINFITVYPLEILLDLALIGLPCAVLGAMNAISRPENNRSLCLATAIYSGIVLGLSCFFRSVISSFSTMISARTGGAEYLVNRSCVLQEFSWTAVFANVALVLLLVAGVIGVCSKKDL